MNDFFKLQYTVLDSKCDNLKPNNHRGHESFYNRVIYHPDIH